MGTFRTADSNLVYKLMMRLLPIQVLIAAVGAVNDIISSYYASNYVGVDALSAVGLYGPVSLFIGAISSMMVGGAAILCGMYVGRTEREKTQKIFSLSITLAALIGIIASVVLLAAGSLDLTGLFTRDVNVRPLFNTYIQGKSIGILPYMVGSQLTAFLTMENRGRLTTIASIISILVNLAMNVIFVQVMHMEAYGLALAASIGIWAFFLAEALYFIGSKTYFKFSLGRIDLRETWNIMYIGLHGALGNAYQTIRGLIVNHLLESAIGTAAISSFAAANNLMGLFWAIPAGMLGVSRLLISVAEGEEDRQTLRDIMRVMFRRYVPLMIAINVIMILCAEPMAGIFFHDHTEPVFTMCADGFRILPICMPFSIICMHFVCYAQASDHHDFVHISSLLDGVVCVSLFTALLIRFMGMNSVYVANVLNGIVCVLYIVIYSIQKKGHFPRTLDDLMVIRDDFGVQPEDRLDITGVNNIGDVVMISEQVQRFFEGKGVEAKRAYYSALAVEEMAGNIVDHGFNKDNKEHSVDIRVLYKDGDVILRLRDDCIPFNPEERLMMSDPEDPIRNIGIKMVFRMASDIRYQNVLGLNVLTIRLDAPDKALSDTGTEQDNK